MRAIPLILKATQRARAQRLASLGAGRVALCVNYNKDVRAKHGERRPINGFRQAMALQRFKNAKPAGELW